MRLLLIALIALMTLSSVFDWDPGPAPGVKLKNGILYLLALGVLLRVAVDRRVRIELPQIQIAFIVLILYAIASYLAVVLVIDYPYYDKLDNALILKSLVDQLFFFAVFFYGLRSEEDALPMVKFLAVAFALSHVMAVLDALNIVQFGDIERREDGRVQGLVGESNQYGAFVAMSLPTVVALALSTRGLQRWIWLAASGITAITLLMTVSRGAFVAVFVAGVCALVMFRRYAPPGRLLMFGGLAVLGVAVVAIAAVALGFGELLYERVIAGASGDMESTSSGRTQIWATALGKMFENPISLITGFGWRAYWSMPFRFAPHNYYLNMWFNLGLVGLACGLTLLVLPVRYAKAALAASSYEARATLMGFIIATISLAVATFFVDLHIPWLYYWAYAGVVLRIAMSAMHSPALEPVKAPPRTGVRSDPFGWVAPSSSPAKPLKGVH